VTTWAVVFLGLMALALLTMAAVQVAFAIQAAKLARQAADAMESVRREVRPLIEKATRVTDDAARAASLAAAQVERVDQMMRTTTERIDETMGIVQHAIIVPVRQGAAVVAAVRAAFDVLRGRRRQGHDEDEALFVG
jgi:hypothetical protein